jgi:uncharacterized protein (UPF0261 family)
MIRKKGIVVVCNLDTRGEDIVFVKQLIQGRGIDAILLDFRIWSSRGGCTGSSG